MVYGYTCTPWLSISGENTAPQCRFLPTGSGLRFSLGGLTSSDMAAGPAAALEVRCYELRAQVAPAPRSELAPTLPSFVHVVVAFVFILIIVQSGNKRADSSPNTPVFPSDYSGNTLYYFAFLLLLNFSGNNIHSPSHSSSSYPTKTWLKFIVFNGVLTGRSRRDLAIIGQGHDSALLLCAAMSITLQQQDKDEALGEA